MEMIYSDIEDQEKQARRKGIPIEISKYKPEEPTYYDNDDEEEMFEGEDFDDFGS